MKDFDVKCKKGHNAEFMFHYAIGGFPTITLICMECRTKEVVHKWMEQMSFKDYEALKGEYP